jgi:hypothetical protein
MKTASLAEVFLFFLGPISTGPETMSNYELYEIRPLRERDVIGVLRVIGDVRKEYGLEGRVNEIIEPSDRDLFVTYERERSEYFVAHNGAVLWEERASRP